MIRLYGNEPYNIVLVHGGPGAIGSLKGFAKELSNQINLGVVEAIQSKYSVEELIEELHCQIKENCLAKVTLIGHSWGAWLVAFFAGKHPDLVKEVVLIGCGPLEDKYIAEISLRRLENLSGEDANLYKRLINNQVTDEDMKRVPVMLEKSDNFCLEEKELHGADKTDSEMYNLIWSQAATLRTDGKLLEAFQKIKSKIYLIQGEYDPHPVKGVTIPLQENNIPCQSYALKKCGHSPFMEKYAKDEFYNILHTIIWHGKYHRK